MHNPTGVGVRKSGDDHQGNPASSKRRVFLLLEYNRFGYIKADEPPRKKGLDPAAGERRVRKQS